MNNSKKIVAALIAVAACLSGLSACGTSSSNSDKGHVYFLNSKAEQADQWDALASQFTDETGIAVDVTTATAGTYDQSLKSELAKSEAPTLFNVGDMNSFYNWTDYYADMSDTSMYKDLTSSDYALKDGDKVAAVPYVMERYGIIYNKALLKKYFDSSWASITSIDDLNNFDALKTVADEIQKHKDELGVKGAFTSAGFDSSSDWRYKNQLAEIPIFYEYRDKGVTKTPETISDKYLPNFKNIFDLYLNDETIERSMLSSATGDDAAAEFALGEAVFYQNGSWAYSQIRDQEVADSDIGVLPIYIGVDGEEDAGLTVSFNYFSINKNASEIDRKATEQFLDWVLNNDDARKVVVEEMGFETPFKSYQEGGFVTSNPILRANDDYQKAGKYDVVIYPLPSTQWGDSLGNSMLEYAQGTGEWSAVESAFVGGWASEYKAAGLAEKLGQ